MPREGLPRALGIPLIGVVLVGLFAATGCGGKFYWSKPGSTAAEFERDSKQCAQEASQDAGGRFDLNYRKCLTERGYSREHKTEPGPGWYRGIE